MKAKGGYMRKIAVFLVFFVVLGASNVCAGGINYGSFYYNDNSHNRGFYVSGSFDDRRHGGYHHYRDYYDQPVYISSSNGCLGWNCPSRVVVFKKIIIVKEGNKEENKEENNKEHSLEWCQCHKCR